MMAELKVVLLVVVLVEKTENDLVVLLVALMVDARAVMKDGCMAACWVALMGES